MKYRKKPVVIDAFQYDGDMVNRDGLSYVPDWAFLALSDETMYYAGQGELYIKTLEGDHHVSVGDYIIQGVAGEIYPCKSDIFEQTYGPAESAPTIDAVPVVHGRWIPCEYRPTLYCKCSECGRMKEWLENMEWCPHCGAKMNKEEPT